MEKPERRSGLCLDRRRKTDNSDNRRQQPRSGSLANSPPSIARQRRSRSQSQLAAKSFANLLKRPQRRDSSTADPAAQKPGAGSPGCSHPTNRGAPTCAKGKVGRRPLSPWSRSLNWPAARRAPRCLRCRTWLRRHGRQTECAPQARPCPPARRESSLRCCRQ